MNESQPWDKPKIKEMLKEYKKLRAIRNKIPSGEITKMKKGAVYVRYADDWVLAITGTQTEAEEIKERIANYLEVQRKMKLDDEKTKITRASDGYKFLGFEIRLNTSKPKLIRVLLKDKNGKYSRPLRRTTLRLITVEPDSKKILERLKNKKFCDQKGKPVGKAAWTVYNEFQIVQKFA